MENEKKRGFHWRGFTSLALTVSFLMMAFSGVMLFLTPKGRVANWTGWTLLGLTKEEWASVHIAFGVFLLVVSAFHIYFNWRPLMHYIKKKTQQGLNLKAEMAIALILGVVFFWGTLAEVPPFGTLLSLGDQIKDYWEDNAPSAPQAHAEDLRLGQFSQQIGFTTADLIAKMKEKGFEVTSPEMTVGEVAEMNGVAPSEIYEAITGKAPDEALGTMQSGQGMGQGAGGMGQGGGWGRMSLSQVCSQEGIDTDAAIQWLKNTKGVQAGPNDNLRSIADKANLTPRDLVDALKAL